MRRNTTIPVTHPLMHFFRLAIISLFLTLPATGSGAEMSSGEEARELRELMYQLKHRVEVLERQQLKKTGPDKPTAPQQKAPVKQIIAPGNKKAPLPVSQVMQEPPVNKINYSFGGQIVVEAVSNWPGSSATSEFDLRPIGVPTGSGGENGQFNFSARETRLWFKTVSKTRLGLIKTLLEMDFKGSAGEERVNNSHNPRMRHGYARLGNFTIGQTESTFANLLAWPDTIPDAIAYISNRQVMVRWTQKLDEEYSFQIALENPETTLTNASGTRVTPSDDRFPDLAVKGLWYGKRGSSLALSGLLREIRSDGAVVGGVEDSEVGGALYFSGRLNTIDSDNVRFGLAGGNALGRYASLNSFNDGSIDANGRIELNMLYLGYISYQYWLNDHWRLTPTATHIMSDNNLSRVPDSTVKDAQSFHLRLSWLPLVSTNFSVEYAHVRSELENGLEGEQNRLHFSMLYRF